MINPRILMQLPLIFLGSCMPLTTTSIVVYTENPQFRTSDGTSVVNTIPARKRASDDAEDKCKKLISSEELRTYKLPPRANLSNISDGDDRAVMDAVLDENEILRNELKRLKLEFECTLKVHGL